MTDFEAWLNKGWDEGWISPVFCGTHDGWWLTEDEYELNDDEDIMDRCMPSVRILIGEKVGVVQLSGEP